MKGWYGTKKGLRGRFSMYMTPLLEAPGLAEVEHNPKNNRMRAKWKTKRAPPALFDLLDLVIQEIWKGQLLRWG